MAVAVVAVRVLQVLVAVVALRVLEVLDAEKGTKEIPGVRIYLQLDSTRRLSSALIASALFVLYVVGKGPRQFLSPVAWIFVLIAALCASGLLVVEVGARDGLRGVTVFLHLSRLWHIEVFLACFLLPPVIHFMQASPNLKRVAAATALLCCLCFNSFVLFTLELDMPLERLLASDHPCPKQHPQPHSITDVCAQFPNEDAMLPNGTLVAFRFPSVTERVQYYMGGWDDANATLRLDRTTLPTLCPPGWDARRGWSDRTMLLTEEALAQYPGSALWSSNRYSARYFGAIAALLHPDATAGGAAQSVASPAGAPASAKPAAALVVFGDSVWGKVLFPVVAKAREARGPAAAPRPVLWPLNFERHLGFLADADCRALLQATAWADKRETLVWRGATTGRRFELLRRWADFADKAAVDVAFTRLTQGCSNALPECTRRQRPPLSMQETVGFKYLLSVEGNDAASGLKWMLFSNSVVLMPLPTVATWAMEDLLVPWLHFVPLRPDLSDLLEQLAWARANPRAAQAIACRSSAFIARLFGSEEAHRDHHAITAAISAVYRARFADALNAFCPEPPAAEPAPLW